MVQRERRRRQNVWYRFISRYNAVVVVCLVVLGVLHAFVLHNVLLDRVDAREALTRSRQMVRQNLRSFLVQTLLFNLRCTLAAALLIFVAMVPAAVVYASGGPRVLLLFFVLSGAAVSSFASFLLDPFFVLKLTQLYYGYSRGETVTIPARDRGTIRLRWLPLWRAWRCWASLQR